MGAFHILSELLQNLKLSHNEVTNEWNFTRRHNFVLL